MFARNAKHEVQKLLRVADVRTDGARPWDITVLNQDFFERLLHQGSLGLGESYMDGWWECDSIDECLCRILSAGLERRALRDWRSVLRYIFASVFNRQTRLRSRDAVERHYDLGNPLYQNMLDRRMVYTCARWMHASGLNEAQERKLNYVCRKLNLREGMHLLDIGCGWGSLARFAAQKYGARVTGITLSHEQLQLGQQMCAQLPVDLHLEDYRDLNETFDCVASLGVLEHVGYKNYRIFFETAHRSLAPNGLFFLSTIASARSAHTIDPWIDKYIFPNSQIPSASQIGKAIRGLFTINALENWGLDYDRTLMAWFQNFNRNWSKLKSKYDLRFYRMWKYYLLASAASFRSRHLQVWQILLSRQ